MPRKTSPYKQVILELNQLTDPELQDIADMIRGILEAREDERTVQENAAMNYPGGQRGSIEEKQINGCGPYLYLRYWNGKIHRSKYIGKRRG